MRLTQSSTMLLHNYKNSSDSDIGLRAIFVPFWGGNCDFLKVFVPRILIFKKLHLILHTKLEVQGEKDVENHQLTHSQLLANWVIAPFRVLND